MRINLVGAFIRNAPFGTEIAFKKGFDRLGEHLVNCIDTSYPNQIWDYDADATIVFKWMEGYWYDLEQCKGKKIVYQPDDIRFGHIRQMMTDMRKYCDYALTYDVEAAQIAQSLGYKKAQRLLLTADPELYHHIPDKKKDIDLSFVGSLTYGANHAGRRRMVELLHAEGLRIFAASDVYDISKIVDIYNRSKIVLNHATDVGQPFGQGYGYQCRHFEAGFTKACVLSNSVIDDDGALKNFASYNNERHLVGMVRFLLSEDKLREVYAQKFYDELNASHRPEHRAREMVEFIGSL